MIGINVRTQNGIDYAELIVTGRKTLETRATNSLKPYIGKRVAIVRTGGSRAHAIGSVKIVSAVYLSKKQFRELEPLHHVPMGSEFDTTEYGKWVYEMVDPVVYRRSRRVAHGIIARRVL